MIKQIKTNKSWPLLLLMLFIMLSCRKENVIPSPEITPVEPGIESGLVGFYLLNEGNMGSNKATLDFFDFKSGNYFKNIYAERNPSVVKELGDVGNDLQIYGDKLYAVINCSHFVEVMDVSGTKHITQISIPNCRYIVFKDGFAYVSSYAGPVMIDPNARLGYVAKIDTLSLKVVESCVVGYQPEEMVIVGDKLYVANSGGYRVPNYDRTVSVIDLKSFKEIKKIDVAINLHRMELDNYGNIWVSSRGDYYNTPSKVFIIDSKSDSVVGSIDDMSVSNMTICGDSLYVLGTEWNYTTQSNSVNYAIVNVKTKSVVSRNFIAGGVEKQIEIPYGIAVNPENRDIYITDAKDYVTPGKLFCFTKEGVLKWEITTGDIPAHIAFSSKPFKK